MLSVLDLPISLNPSRLGFEVYYADQFVFHRDLEDDSGKVKRHEKLGAPYFALDSYGDGPSTLLTL
jgi:hypothetical protein